jgi:23S rRNA pseudouridine1911/1915/1917 synthase
MKLSSRDLLSILRLYEVAGEDNIPRQVEMIKISHPSPINALASFCFAKRQFYVLLDDTAEDNIDYILSQIKSRKADTQGELIHNPRDEAMTYGMPFRGKSCYLFAEVSDKNRLDKELASRYPEISRSTWQKYIKSGYVKVNGQVMTSTKYDVADIDDIAINIPAAPEYSKNELPIIYIDDNVIVINKPAGILSHAKGAVTDEFTVADFFRRYTSYNVDTNRPGIVHRLDRDTSGVMIGARNPETAIVLQKQFSDRKTKKTYYAILNGIPKLAKANIDLPIGRNPASPSTFRVDSNGKSALTRYEIIASDDKYSLVKLQPLTGRTHQLRVHMKYINTPILGDRVYGKSSDRLYLHAYSLEITIPGGNRQTFVAPIPSDISSYFPEAEIC